MAQQQMSLFGPSLAQTQAGIAQEDEAITAKLAQLSPEQQLTRVALQGGRQAGKALGGLFGIEDPRLKEAAQQEAIFKELKDSGVDFTDSEQLYPALINAYQSRGMIDKAIVAAAKLEDIKATKLKSEAEIGLKGAQVTKALADARKALTENLPTVAKLQKLRDDLRAARSNAESDQQLAEIDQKLKELDSAINKESTFAPSAAPKPESFGVDREATSQALYGKRFGDLTQQEQQAVNKQVDETTKKSTKIDINLSQDKGINATKVKRFGDLEDAAVAADSVLNNVNTISSVLNNAFTGVGAGVALKAGQIANALGVQVTGTTESEQLNQLLAKLAQGQARTLPGSLSEKELMFLREAIGTGGMTKQTLQAMLRRMREDAIADKEAYKDAFNFEQGGGNLNKYDFATSRTKARTTAKRISDLLEKATPEQRRQLGY
jgi:hypothetical protein